MSGLASAVSQTTNTLKWTSVGVISFSLFAMVWAAASDTSGFIYRYSARYVAGIDRKLRPMFIFSPNGKQVALMQCAAAFFVLGGHALMTIEYWWAMMFLIAIFPTVYIEVLRRKRVEALEMQLDGFILALANALKSTPSIGAAFNSVVTVVSEPTRSEIDLAVKEMKVGSTLDQALLHMAARVGSRQLDSALSSILIGRQVGGNLPKVLETTANTLREMRRLEGVVRTKTAEGKAQIWVIALLPFGMLVGLNILFPGYFLPLTGSISGYIVIAFCTTSWITSIVLARKILNVDI